MVPELNLSDFTRGDDRRRAAFSAAFAGGLRRYGFVILYEHDLDADLLARAYALAKQCFALPEGVKRQYIGGPRGYAPFRSETAKDHPTPDLKEFWQLGQAQVTLDEADPTFVPNRWPVEVPGFEPCMNALFQRLEGIGIALLRALAPSLQLPEDYFDGWVRGGNSILRLIHYPPSRSIPAPGSLRAAAHEDINLITILVAAQGAGLELLDRDGRWLPVEAHAGGLIVDSGDMMARLTNDVIPATTHRVINTGMSESRYSMPFFMHPVSSMPLDCLSACVGGGERYAPITAGEFLAERLRAIGLL